MIVEITDLDKAMQGRLMHKKSTPLTDYNCYLVIMMITIMSRVYHPDFTYQKVELVWRKTIFIGGL